MKVIITGATGMVGKGVLLECLDSKDVEHVLVVNRSTINLSHPKLEELIVTDFFYLENYRDRLMGYDACFFCMGISSVGISEEQFTKVTYSITKIFVDILYACNPQMVFNYVSGEGTDSSESGRVMWARVKGKTENYILNKGFKDAYMFRANVIIPEKGIVSKTKLYNFFYVLTKPIHGLLKRTSGITTTTKVGVAMIHSVLYPQRLKLLENKDINQLAAKNR